MDILVIGNGFDLAHGLKTSYKDFLVYCKSIKQTNCDPNNAFKNCYECNLWMKHFSTIYNNLGEDWIDFEEEIYNAIANIQQNISISEFEQEHKLFIIYKNDINFTFNSLDKYMHESLVLKGYNERGYIIHNNNDHIQIIVKNYQSFINFLFDQLRELTKVLELYLSSIISSNICNKRKYNFALTESKILRVVNFNYTSTFETLYKSKYPNNKWKIYNIHGKLNCKNSCNLVLGTKSSDSKFQINDEFNPFKKHTQRFKYNTIDDFQNIFDDLNNINRNSNIVFHTFGHSLGEIDHTLLKELFDINKTFKIRIYYHTDASKDRLLNNITKMLNDEAEVSRRVTFVKFDDKNNGILKPIEKQIHKLCNVIN